MLIYLATMLLSVFICLRMQSLQSHQGCLSSKLHNTQVAYCLLLIVIVGVVVGWRKEVGTDCWLDIDIYYLT